MIGHQSDGVTVRQIILKDIERKDGSFERKKLRGTIGIITFFGEILEK